MRRALVAADAASLAGAVTAALLIGDAGGRSDAQLPLALAAVPLFQVLFRLYGLYAGDDRRMAHSTLDDLVGVFHAMVLGTLALWAGLKALGQQDQLIFFQAALLLAFGVVFTLVARQVVRWLVGRLAPRERVLVVGSGREARLLAAKMRLHPDHGRELVGYVTDDDDPALGDVICHGRVRDLVSVCHALDVERVIAASPAIDDRLLTDLVREANCADLKVSLLPSVADVLGSSAELDQLEGVTLLSINPVRLSPAALAVKRTLDVTVSALVLLLVLPLLPVVALAIRLDSPGPVFFTQDRAGRGGRRFRLVKLRTMTQDAEARAEGLRAQSRHAAWLLLDDDPRVTRVGRVLRLTSIDELPQLWNVLRGDMSLVGPRPMPVDTDQHIIGWGRRRVDLTPGITGLWQVLGRTSIPFEEMLKLDYLYVTNWSVAGDLRLLLRTIPVVLRRRGAN